VSRLPCPSGAAGGVVQASRASTRLTCTGCHSPRPFAVGIPDRFKPSAMACSVAAPAACSSAMVAASAHRPLVGDGCTALATSLARLRRQRDAAIAAKLPAASLRRLQGRLDMLGNHLGFVLGNGREDMDGEPVRGRKVHRDEIDTGFHEVRNEGDVPGEPVQLGDNQLTYEGAYVIQAGRAGAAKASCL
jgi:hypothetical protein